MKFAALWLAGCLALLSSCNNNSTPNDVKSIPSIEHSATSNQMLGTWQYQNLDFDFKINVNLPGIEEQLKSNMLKKIEKEIEGTKVTYKADGSFEVQSAKNNTTGKYKVENNELVHSDFNNQETIMSYANAEVDGDILTLQVTEEQFWKMLGSLPAAQNGIDQIKQMITVNRLVYTFKKVN